MIEHTHKTHALYAISSLYIVCIRHEALMLKERSEMLEYRGDECRFPFLKFAFSPYNVYTSKSVAYKIFL